MKVKIIKFLKEIKGPYMHDFGVVWIFFNKIYIYEHIHKTNMDEY